MSKMAGFAESEHEGGVAEGVARRSDDRLVTVGSPSENGQRRGAFSVEDYGRIPKPPLARGIRQYGVKADMVRIAEHDITSTFLDFYREMRCRQSPE